MNISRVRIRSSLGGAVDTVKFNQRRAGLLGRPDGGGVYTVTVPGGHGYKFVRLMQGLGSSLAIAVDKASVGTTGNTPVWLEYDSDKRLIIVGLRYEGS